jgi:adenylate cyclase
MEAPPLDRRLVAILAADVEGYSRLMHGDEEATMATLSHRRLLVDDLIAQYRGRIANTAGDSVLAEFASVLDAVRCAVEIQATLDKANENDPDERRMRFRIGVNIGDVMVKEGDLFGDGVNVAARLEGLVKGGEICVSRGVRDHLRHRGGFIFEDLGEQLVKNIAHPIRAFRLRPGENLSEPELPPAEKPVEAVEPPSRPAAISELSAESEVALELALWNSVKDGTTAELETYLEQYPEGLSLRLPAPGSMLHRTQPPRAQRNRSRETRPLMLSIWHFGSRSRTAVDPRSCRHTLIDTQTAISPRSPGHAWRTRIIDSSRAQRFPAWMICKAAAPGRAAKRRTISEESQRFGWAR